MSHRAQQQLFAEEGEGWHVGPCFACEVVFGPSQARQAACWGFSKPWLRLERADSHEDTLQVEHQLCWRQFGIGKLLREEGGLGKVSVHALCTF